MRGIFEPGPDLTPVMGNEYTDWEGTVFRLVSQSGDMHTPYFAKVQNGKVGKILFYLEGGEELGRKWLDAITGSACTISR